MRKPAEPFDNRLVAQRMAQRMVQPGLAEAAIERDRQTLVGRVFRMRER